MERQELCNLITKLLNAMMGRLRIVLGKEDPQ